MILNLIFTKINLKKHAKTIQEYRHEESIREIIEQNKLKHTDLVLRNYY